MAYYERDFRVTRVVQGAENRRRDPEELLNGCEVKELDESDTIPLELMELMKSRE